MPRDTEQSLELLGKEDIAAKNRVASPSCDGLVAY